MFKKLTKLLIIFCLITLVVPSISTSADIKTKSSFLPIINPQSIEIKTSTRITLKSSENEVVYIKEPKINMKATSSIITSLPKVQGLPQIVAPAMLRLYFFNTEIDNYNWRFLKLELNGSGKISGFVNAIYNIKGTLVVENNFGKIIKEVPFNKNVNGIGTIPVLEIGTPY